MLPNELDMQIQRAREQIVRCREEIAQVLVGQPGLVNGLLTGLLTGGHVLLEGVPGLAKTLAVKTLAEVVDASFKRIQFTPDLLPADIIGTMVYRQQTGEFTPRKGPVFSNIILADEINRAPAKVQSALLEAMEEHQVTIGDNTYPLPDPFFVLATQNPIEHEGTYPLPEAQLDRFLIKIKVDYPTRDEELQVLRKSFQERSQQPKRVLFKPDIKRFQDIMGAITMDARLEQYVVDIVLATRGQAKNAVVFSRYLSWGASVRATIALAKCARVRAFLDGRSHVMPEDVKVSAAEVLRHRLVLSYEAEADQLDADDIVAMVLKTVDIP